MIFFSDTGQNSARAPRPSLEMATKLHFIFASKVEKPLCESIFHPAKAITGARRGVVTYSKRRNVFTLSGVRLPGGAICL